MEHGSNFTLLSGERIEVEFEERLQNFLLYLGQYNPVMLRRIKVDSGIFSVHCLECESIISRPYPHVLFEVRYAFGKKPGDYVLFQISIISDHHLHAISYQHSGRVSNGNDSLMSIKLAKNGCITYNDLCKNFNSLLLKSLRRFLATQRLGGFINGVSIMPPFEAAEYASKH